MIIIAGRLLAASAVIIQPAQLQPTRHASCQLPVIVLALARLHCGVRLQDLCYTKLELGCRNDFPLHQILLLLGRQYLTVAAD